MSVLAKKLTNHDELELKFEVDPHLVTVEKFIEAGFMYQPLSYLKVGGPDAYYSNGTEIIRHRVSPDNVTGELTVKKRRSQDSILNRQEIDLRFAQNISIYDVQAFLAAIGFKRQFTVIKNCHIFFYKDCSVVMYDAWEVKNEGKGYRFIEVEIEKSSCLSQEEGKKLLDVVVRNLRKVFKVGFPETPSNLSLYELFSGKMYAIEEKSTEVSDDKYVKNNKRELDEYYA